MEKPLEQKMLELCVKYCYDLSVDDPDGGMMKIMFGDLTEGEIFEGFERLSQKYGIFLDEASPGE
jgi:hypothetical protein